MTPIEDRVRFLIHWWNDNPEDVNAFHIEVMESPILGPEEEPEPDGRDDPIQLMLDCIQLGDYLNFVEHIHAQGAVNEGLVDVNAAIHLRFYRDHLVHLSVHRSVELPCFEEVEIRHGNAVDIHSMGYRISNNRAVFLPQP